jgi:hypothetical protein
MTDIKQLLKEFERFVYAQSLHTLQHKTTNNPANAIFPLTYTLPISAAYIPACVYRLRPALQHRRSGPVF